MSVKVGLPRQTVDLLLEYREPEDPDKVLKQLEIHRERWNSPWFARWWRERHETNKTLGLHALRQRNERTDDRTDISDYRRKASSSSQDQLSQRGRSED